MFYNKWWTGEPVVACTLVCIHLSIISDYLSIAGYVTDGGHAYADGDVGGSMSFVVSSNVTL